jgi:hypothetical protein
MFVLYRAESVRHFFRMLCGSKHLGSVFEILGFPVGRDFESILKLWLRLKKIQVC